MHYKTKTLKILLILLLTYTLVSCTKIFDSLEADLTHITTDQEMEFAFTGIYNGLANSFRREYTNYQVINGDDVKLDYHYELQIDSVTESGEIVFSSECSNKYPDRSDYSVNFSWEFIYKTITSVNNVISQYERNSLSERFKPYVGEAYFIRAFCYFRLTRVFGNIPLVKNIDVDYNLGLASYKEIYTLITDDLNRAIELLPPNNSSARVPLVSPHRGAAKALLAEVYLTMAGYPLQETENYKNAARLAGEVIDSAAFFGFSLLPDYADLWNAKHPVNTESVFCLNYSLYNLNRELDVDHDHRWGEFFRTSSGIPLIFCNDLNGIATETLFYNHFPESYRKNITFHREGQKTMYKYEVNSEGIITKGDSTTISFYRDSISYCQPMTLKKLHYNIPIISYYDSIEWVSHPEGDYFERIAHYKYNPVTYLFRYAHTLLTYAEAKARAGELDASAYEAVNQIRRRANKVAITIQSEFDLQPGLSVDQFADSVVWERAWEFAGEQEGRWFDLLRLDLADQLHEFRDPNEPPERPYSYVNWETYFVTIPWLSMIWLE